MGVEAGEGAARTGLRPDDVLASLKNLLVDMDGVLFRGDSVLPGAPEFLPWLTARGVAFRLLTNNSTATPVGNAAKLAAMGIEVQPEDVFTSSQATARYLTEQGLAGRPAFVIGEEGLRTALGDAGLTCVTSWREADLVVTGLDRSVTYETLKTASLAIERGARFIATNADTSLPVEEGEVPGAGAIQAAITATTGVRPVVIGKPEPTMLRLAMEALGGDLSNTAMLGDRLDTDIEAAHRTDMTSILVLTGVTTQEDLDRSSLQPTVTFPNLPDLMRAWTEASPVAE